MYYIFHFAILFVYTFFFYKILDLPTYEMFQYISAVLYIVMSAWYLVRCRKNYIFCPEIILIILGFVITFFDILVLNNIGYVGGLFGQFSDKMIQRSTCLSLIAFSSFFLGAEIAKQSFSKNISKMPTVYRNVPVGFAMPMHFFVLFVLFVIFISGQYMGFMKYTAEEGQSTNMINIFTSILIMVGSVLEFLRLHNIFQNPKKQSQPLTSFIIHINKLYVFNVILWSFFLLLTGNRGEMMLIAVPPIILFFFLIRKIGNKIILIGAMIGVFVMVFIGLTRQNEGNFAQNASELGIYGVFRDYGAAYVNQQGLIQYTDVHGTYGYGAGIKSLISSVPFLGGLLIGNQTTTNNDGNTNILTTEQWQLSSNMDSGLGTNLLGDLYYAGGLFFVVLYMFVLGWFLSYAYERLFYGKRLNMFSLFTYCWLFADSLYILRAPYYHLFRQIGFSLLIYFFIYLLYNPTFLKNSKRL